LHNQECSNIVRAALDIGYRHIDTAQMYKNERAIGSAINISNVRREDIFLSTKIWHTNLAADDVMKSTAESLKNLDTADVDLLMIHWPNEQYDLRETIESMLVLRDQGKALNIGVSNFPLSMLKKANEEIMAPIFCDQVEFHPFIDQLNLLDYAIENDIMLTAYAPLAKGTVAENEELQQIAANYDKSASQIALRWLIEQENVVAIPKASDEEHLRQNFDVFDFYLEDEDFERIDELEKGQRLV